MSEAIRIENEAAAWLIAKEEPGWDAAHDAELLAWLEASFAHKAAYWRLEDAWRQADRIASIGPKAVWTSDAEERGAGDAVPGPAASSHGARDAKRREQAARGLSGAGRTGDLRDADGAGSSPASRDRGGDADGWMVDTENAGRETGGSGSHAASSDEVGAAAARSLGDDALAAGQGTAALLGDGRPARYGERSGLARWQPLALAASLLIAVFLGYNGWQSRTAPASLEQLGPIAIASTPPERARLVETGTEKKKLVNLSDGSRIELAASSMIHADIRPEARHVWLDNGEAYFDVKHAADIPFVIHAGSRVVTVLGTRFSVRRDGDKVRVNVVEGRVRVDEIAAPGAPALPVRSTIITGGDLAVARGSSTMVEAAAPEKVEGQLGWRKGVLNFDRMTLGEAAAEFNRFNARKIVVDADVAGMRIGGTFKTDNIDDFAELLREAYGLKVDESSGTIKISD